MMQSFKKRILREDKLTVRDVKINLSMFTYKADLREGKVCRIVCKLDKNQCVEITTSGLKLFSLSIDLEK